MNAAPMIYDSTFSIRHSKFSIQEADRYHVYYGTDMAKMQLFSITTASELEVRGLVEGTKYFFYVKAVKHKWGERGAGNKGSKLTREAEGNLFGGMN